MPALKRLAAILIAALVVGCAASGPLYTEVASTLPNLQERKGRIFFYRPDTIIGAAVTSDINLNGALVGKSERGSFFFVDADPGNYRATASTEVEREVTFTLAAGETKYIKTTVSMGLMLGRVNLELVNPGDLRTAFAELHYTGAAEQPGAEEEAGEQPKGDRPIQRGGRRRKFQSASPPESSP